MTHPKKLQEILADNSLDMKMLETWAKEKQEKRLTLARFGPRTKGVGFAGEDGGGAFLLVTPAEDIRDEKNKKIFGEFEHEQLYLMVCGYNAAPRMAQALLDIIQNLYPKEEPPNEQR